MSSLDQTVSTGRLKHGRDLNAPTYDDNVNAMQSEISHDGDSTEMRTVRNSSESLLYRDMGSVLPQNVVIENTSTGLNRN
mmetsp:Transcript_1195/g.1580  ORF Transcript_1195/g.1580 Transcript_1195/m.1580 type:complete len:80 (-) Transcript_1195:406-645(-)